MKTQRLRDLFRNSDHSHINFVWVHTRPSGSAVSWFTRSALRMGKAFSLRMDKAFCPWGGLKESEVILEINLVDELWAIVSNRVHGR